MSIVLNSSSGGSVTINEPTTASNFTQTLPAATGDVVVAGANSAIVSGTAVASTSGTSIDFTSIPSWVKRITVMFNGVSTNGGSVVLVQLGDSGGIETTGYGGVSSELYTTISTVISPSNGIGTQGGMSSSIELTGHLVLTLLSSNAWVGTGAFYRVGATNMTVISAGKTLSATLDRVRITTASGTDAFDAGSINILYE